MCYEIVGNLQNERNGLHKNILSINYFEFEALGLVFTISNYRYDRWGSLFTL